MDETPDNAKVALASLHFKGRALQWHQGFMKTRITRDWPSWGEYVRALFSQFGTALYDDPMGDLKDLIQTSSVQNYVDVFDELLIRVDLNDEYIVCCFVRGLKPGIGLPIKMFQPRTLEKAIGLARIQEQTLSPHKQPTTITPRSLPPILPPPKSNPKLPNSQFQNSTYKPPYRNPKM